MSVTKLHAGENADERPAASGGAESDRSTVRLAAGAIRRAAAALPGGLADVARALRVSRTLACAWADELDAKGGGLSLRRAFGLPVSARRILAAELMASCDEGAPAHDVDAELHRAHRDLASLDEELLKADADGHRDHTEALHLRRRAARTLITAHRLVAATDELERRTRGETP